MTTIYASTACISGKQPLVERVRLYREHGIDAIELGARVTIDGTFSGRDMGAGRFILHNYFPPPAEPFVLNLASANAAIRVRSIALVQDALSISASLGASVYSVHAGFITDPSLDFVFPSPASASFGPAALRRFVESIRALLPVAEKEGVKLLIENNVCAPHNRGTLLLQTTEEFQEFFHMVSSPHLGILVDTGHLNVSATTFGFDRMAFIDALAPQIGAFHLHDNDGSADQHRPLTEGSWIVSVLCRPVVRDLPWIVEAQFPDTQSLAAHIDFLASLKEKR